MAAVEKKLVRSKSGMRIVHVNEGLISPLFLPEPQWVPDSECPHCISCKAKFDFFTRKHHCRRCGKCFCSTCCSTNVPLPRMYFVDPVRHCQKCAPTSSKESEFFERHLKTLTNGATFLVSGRVSTPVMEDLPYFSCHVSSDHRFIMLEPQGSCSQEYSPVALSRVEAMQILGSSSDNQGNKVASGLALSYRGESGNTETIRLMAPEKGQRRQAMAWVAAMQKAMRLLLKEKQEDEQ